MEDIPLPSDSVDVVISNKESTQNSAEAYGVKAVMMTAVKPPD